MKHIVGGIVAAGLTASEGGEISIICGWPEAALVELSIGAMFGPGTWNTDRRVSAPVAVVRLFCVEVSACCAGRWDEEIAGGEITGPDARAGARGRQKRALPIPGVARRPLLLRRAVREALDFPEAVSPRTRRRVFEPCRCQLRRPPPGDLRRSRPALRKFGEFRRAR